MSGRRVRQLRLTAHSDELVRRGALLVEDALRTASLPEADGGRLYVIKRLWLGNIDASAAPARVALALERRVSQLRAQAVVADSPAAASSACIWFADEHEPWLMLVKRVAAGSGTDEWYWPLVTPGVDLRLPAPQLLRAAVLELARRRLGTVLLVRLVRTLEAAALDALCECLHAADGETLLAATGWSSPRQEAASGVGAAPAIKLPAPVRRWLLRWDGQDPRSIWLAGLALCDGVPARASDPGLARRGAQLVRALVGDAHARTASRAQGRAAQPSHVARWEGGRAPSTASMRAGAARHEREDEQHHAPAMARVDATPSPFPVGAHADAPNAPQVTRAATPAGARAASVTEGSQPARPEPGPTSHAAFQLEGIWTGAAGLLFAIRPLLRLGFADWLTDFPDNVVQGLPARLFWRLARAAHVEVTDPVLGVFDGVQGEATERVALGPEYLTSALSESTAHALFTRHAATGEWLEEPRVLTLWCTAVAVWLRRHARLSLRALVRRKALLHATPTHVDLTFRLHEADIRLRAAGLDLNPGWVPWLGRVVSFHYREEG